MFLCLEIRLLTITQNAAALLANQRAAAGAPESYAVRLSAPPDEDDGEAGLVIAFVPQGLPGDEITEQGGLTAFVAPEISIELRGATLDATLTNGTPPHLVLRR